MTDIICTVITSAGQREALFGDITMPKKPMKKFEIDETRYVLYFENPRDAFDNVVLTRILGHAAKGRCIIVGMNSEDVQSMMPRSTFADLARALPKHVELDEKAKSRLEREKAEYLQRISERRQRYDPYAHLDRPQEYVEDDEYDD